MATLVLLFKKIESEDKTKNDNFHLSSKAEIIINEGDIEDVFQSIYTTIIIIITILHYNNIIDSVIEHTISISKYNTLAGSSSIKLPKELHHPRKGLINIENTDNNECLKWCLIRYLNPADHHPARIIKTN